MTIRQRDAVQFIHSETLYFCSYEAEFVQKLLQDDNKTN
jgi:hypothetical protein